MRETYGPLDDAEMAIAFNHAAEQRDAWVDAEVRKIAPSLADVPERTTRFLSNVQRMLVSTESREAARYAAEVAREAETLAALRCEWARLRVHLMERASLEIRLPVKREEKT